MVTGPSDGRAARLLDGAALALFAAHVALRLSLRGGDGAWGANLFAHLLVPLAAAVWLTARALEGRLPWRLTGLEIPLAILAAVALFSIFAASWRLGAMDGAAGLCAAILAAPLAIHLFGPRGRGALLALMCAIVAVVALYGCVQFVELGDLQSDSKTTRIIAAAGDSGEFEGRVKAREPMSTLQYPNTFAGFLVLALPFVFGMVLDSRSKIATGAGILVLAAGGFCLWATGSGGGWVAAAVAVADFAVLEAIRRWPQWRRALLIASGAVLGVAVILVIAGPLSPNTLAKKSEAIAIRDVYWDAALSVSKAHPFGVGLNNFEDRYYEHKDDRQEEVRTVHNDYLQVLVELGVPGLLAFLALLAVAARSALKPAETEPPVPGACSPVPIAVGIAIGLLFAFGLQGSFGDLGTVAILGAAGIGVFLVMARSGGVGTFARIGLAAGLAGAAVHMLVDFDFWDPGFRLFFFLSLATLMLTARLEPPGEAGFAAAAIAAILFFAIVLPPAAVVAPRFLEAEELASKAEQAEARNRDEEADALWEQAASANRLDPSPAVHLGLREFQRWIALVAQGGAADEARRGDLIITILEDARGRRPRSAAIQARLAEVHEALARRMREKSTGDGMEGATAGAHEAEAEQHARRAVELYPTLAYNQYLLGRILDAAGRSSESVDCFREALRLSSLAVRVPRLRLDGPQAALATLKTGGDRARAIEIFREWRRGQSEERWRARLPILTPEEKSIVDAAPDSK